MKFKIALFLILLASYSVFVYADANSGEILQNSQIKSDYLHLNDINGPERLAKDLNISLDDAQWMARQKMADAQSGSCTKGATSGTARYIGMCEAWKSIYPNSSISVVKPILSGPATAK